MRVLILSTDTKHHTYFINKLAEHFEIAGIIYERRQLHTDYPTGPFFDDEQDRFEERFFARALGGTPRDLPASLARKTITVHSVNRRPLVAYIQALAPDIAVSFGTGQLKPYIFQAARWGTINVHRGLAQTHRGLDSDLWAIYEERFDCLGVTIHYVDAALDTGAILAQERLKLTPAMQIYQLRYETTVIATRLMLDVLGQIAHTGIPPSGQQQTTVGPYYSAMPLALKQRTQHIFETHQELLRHG